MAFFPRFVQNDFVPMFRLMDDYANHVVCERSNNNVTDLFPSLINTQTLRSFQPRFDFSEGRDAYELHGELPGVDHKDVEIEFTDAQTLSVRGKTGSVREEGTRRTAIERQADQGRLERRDSHTSAGSGYQKPTVEDEEGAESGTPVETPAETPADEDYNQLSQAAISTPKTERPKYWISERSVGSFARSFSFPQRVDQDAVKASLKNGVLSIIVPKAAPVSRRITIE